MSNKTKLTLIGLGLTVAGLMVFCRPTSDTQAAEKNYKIWTEEGGEPTPAVPQGFEPTKGFAELVKKVKPAVVNIYTTTVVKPKVQYFGKRLPKSPFDSDIDDLFRHFFGEDFQPPAMKRNSLGSGFIINPDGYCLTNNHVVAGATEIMVKTSDGKEYKAKIIGRDEKYDLALLKIETNTKLPIVPFGDSDKVEVGDWVIAIGNPFGLAHTVTAGIVSAKDRVIGAGPFDDFIQTDASINPGNSGGPLFDAYGRVIGINTAIHASGQGIGFAVPVNMAKSFIRDVMTKGRVTRGWLGVGIQELNEELARALKLSTTSGVLVSQVFAGSPAEKAGIKRGDVILSYNQKRLEGPADLTRLVGTTPPGEKAELTLVREGKEMKITVTIAERKEGEEMAMGGGDEQSEGSKKGTRLLGIKVRDISSKDAERFDVVPGQGVIVENVDEDGPGAEAGIRPQDIILEVNRMQIRSVEDYSNAVGKVKPGDSVLLLVMRGRNYFYAVIKTPE